MSLAASRAVLRQTTFTVRRAGIRNASTTAEATNTVKDTASKAQSKASEGLSKVQSSASSAASSAGSAVNNASQQATGRVGRMVNFVQGQFYSMQRRGVKGSQWHWGFEAPWKELGVNRVPLNGLSERLYMAYQALPERH